MKNKKICESCSPRVLLFLLILYKVHHTNEPGLSFSENPFKMYCFCCSLLMQLFALLSAGSKVKLTKILFTEAPTQRSLWDFGTFHFAASTQQSRVMFLWRSPHLGLKENVKGQRQCKNLVMGQKKGKEEVEYSIGTEYSYSLFFLRKNRDTES